MDFALLSTLIPSVNAGISQVLISYDISCQWHKNFQDHINSYTAFTPLQLLDLEYWRVFIPKFHLPGHGPACQTLFSLSYAKWAGWTDGERIEMDGCNPPAWQPGPGRAAQTLNTTF